MHRHRLRVLSESCTACSNAMQHASGELARNDSTRHSEQCGANEQSSIATAWTCC